MIVTKYVLKMVNPDKQLLESGKVYVGPYNNLVVLFDAVMYPKKDQANAYSDAFDRTEVKKIQITMEEVEND